MTPEGKSIDEGQNANGFLVVYVPETPCRLMSFPYNMVPPIRARRKGRPEGLQVFLDTFNFVRARSGNWSGPFFWAGGHLHHPYLILARMCSTLARLITTRSRKPR